MTDDERIDQLGSDVRHLTGVLRDLMYEVRRHTNAIAGLNQQSKDQEWEARFESLRKPLSDRLDQNMSALRDQVAEHRRQLADKPKKTQASR